MLTLRELQEVNVSRANRWHSGDYRNWSETDWACAMFGEAGEAANAVKKLLRIRTGICQVNDPERLLDTEAVARAAIAEELADMIIYAVILAARVGADIETVVIEKFNRTSAKYGFPERL